jgi:hypothetical protein
MCLNGTNKPSTSRGLAKCECARVRVCESASLRVCESEGINKWPVCESASLRGLTNGESVKEGKG